MLAPREPSPAGPICSKREGFHPSYTSMIWNMCPGNRATTSVVMEVSCLIACVVTPCATCSTRGRLRQSTPDRLHE